MILAKEIAAAWKRAAVFLLAFVALQLAPSVVAAKASGPDVILFNNVRIFDGKGSVLSAPTAVRVKGKVIEVIGSEAKNGLPANALIIEGNGRTLMPGLIDAHTHLLYTIVPQAAILTADLGYLNVAATKAAEEMLMRGFTSVRDVGGPVFGLKKGIDAGLVPGPRIWPSGLSISQTGGHGDFRMPNEVAADTHSHAEMLGAVADSPEGVQLAVRQQLALGASQIKLMAGGGVSSPFDPLDVTQYSPAEMRIAVETAANWGTYVTVHAYTPRAVRQAVEAGVKSVEHGHLIDEPTAKLMAERRTWIVLQAFLDDEDAVPFPSGSAARVKQFKMIEGTDGAYRLARKFGVRVGWGSDTLFDVKLATRQGAQLAKLARWFTPAEVLKIATGDNAQMLGLSGLRSPYMGRIGVIEEGALADLLLVDGDPTAHLDLIADPDKNFLIIMKDGAIYKNSLP
ncbi:metal-dependent hydrolase family protein [Sphingorhabdus sp.]|uniref:metal-dependent hydrolase family protein n=1 Tax=Sphingorhabdus sp. TaxID=1902408 RepID=UPI002FD89BC4